MSVGEPAEPYEVPTLEVGGIAIAHHHREESANPGLVVTEARVICDGASCSDQTGYSGRLLIASFRMT